MAGRRSERVGAAAVGAVALVLLAGSAIAAGPEDGIAVQRGGDCAHAGTDVEDSSTKAVRRAVLCLTNKARAQHADERLRRDRRLQKAAQRHAHAMSETDCLASRCPGEPNLEARLRKTGYFEDARKWGYAENTGCAVSAGAMVESWLGSDVHRASILQSRFEDLGVGILEEGPESRCDEGLAVFSAVFAWRKQ